MVRDPELERRAQGAARLVVEWTRDRDRLIGELRQAGYSLRDIAGIVGLSHTAIAKILRRQKTPAS